MTSRAAFLGCLITLVLTARAGASCAVFEIEQEFKNARGVLVGCRRRSCGQVLTGSMFAPSHVGNDIRLRGLRGCRQAFVVKERATLLNLLDPLNPLNPINHLMTVSRTFALNTSPVILSTAVVNSVDCPSRSTSAFVVR